VTRRTRRGFLGLGALTVGGVLVGRETLFAGDDEAAGPAGWRRAAYGSDEVAVCYSPMRVTATEPEARRRGHTGVIVRKGPSFDAEPAPQNNGDLTVIPVGRHLARQSVRRAPGPGCKPARLRPAVNGFVWGYPADDVRSNKSGWVPVRYAVDDPTYGRQPSDPERWLCGPASHDFDCRNEESKPYCHYKCGGVGLSGLRYTGRLRHVLSAGGEPRNSAEEYYLRWAASSTPFAYLMPGDTVFELGRKKGSSYRTHRVWWSFVEVRHAAYVPAGTRGWCLEDAFLPVGERIPPPYVNPGGTRS
jgi:hypothetical protein